MIFIFYLNLSWHLFFFIIKIWVDMPRQIFFKIKNKPLITSAFSIQHLMVRTILTQGWKVEDQFNTIKKLETNLTQMSKVEDQNDI